MTLFPAVVQELKRRKATDIVVFGGGIIPDDDIAALKKQGVEKLFTPGTPLGDIADWLRKRFPRGEALAAALRQLVVTIVPAILSWIACFCGSQSIQSHPSAPTRQKVKAYSRVQMNPRRAALPIVGY